MEIKIKQQLDLFSDEKSDNNCFLREIDRLEFEWWQEQEKRLLKESDPVVCDPVCLWERG